MIVETIGNIVAAACILSIYSFLYSENRAFRLVEHLFVGIAAGHIVVTTVFTLRSSFWVPLTRGSTMLAIPLVLGLMVYFIFSKKYSYIYRVPMALVVGIGTGLSLRAAAHAQLVIQMATTMVPLITAPFNVLDTFNNILIVIIVIATVSYFFFHWEQRGPLGVSGKIGRYAMMAAFGASFANTVMGRFAVFVGQMDFLLSTEAVYVIPVALALLLFAAYYPKLKKA